MFRNFMNEKYFNHLLMAALFLLSIAAYVNTYHNQFTYDDVPVLLEDNRLRSLNTLPALFTRDYMMTPDHNLYRPLPMLSIAANYLLFGEAPWSYRIVNQALHGLNAVLLFFFLGNFYRDRTGFRFLAAALFAVHPAATETVNLIVYRAELLAFTFSLSAFHLYIQRNRNRFYTMSSVAFYFLAMLSKESAMILPLFLLAYHLYFERRDVRAFLRTMAGYGIAALAVSGIRYAVLGAFGPQNVQQFFSGVPWLSTAYTMVKVIAYYWRIIFWPVNLQMNYDFSDFPVAHSLLDPWVLVSLVFLLAVLAAAAWLYRKDRTLSFFILWPVIALVPVTNVIVPSGVLLAVRLLYLPLAGFSVLLAALLYLPKPLIDRALTKKQEGRARVVFFSYTGIVLIVLFALTLSRNADFKNTETLFKKDLLLSPRNLLSIKFLAPDLPDPEAESLLMRAMNIRPTDSVVLSMLGALAEKKGDHATAEMLQRQSLAVEPTYRAHKQLGIVLSNTGRLDEAVEQFNKVLQLKPFWSEAYEDLAIVFIKKGWREDAFAVIQKALALNRDSANAYNLLGTYYKEARNFDKAAEAYQKSVELYRTADKIKPGLYAALYNLADTSEKLDPSIALRRWTEYIQIAEKTDSEKTWLENARKRVAALSQGQPNRHKGALE